VEIQISLGASLFFIVLYFVVKTAVRNGVVEAHNSMDGGDDEDEDSIAMTTCPNCGRCHDIDYPKCPRCGHS